MTTLAFPMTTLSIYVVPAGRDTKSRMNKLVKKNNIANFPFLLLRVRELICYLNLVLLFQLGYSRPVLHWRNCNKRPPAFIYTHAGSSLSNLYTINNYTVVKLKIIILLNT